MTKLEMQARAALAENVRLQEEIVQLKADLVSAEVRRESELNRARFIISTTITLLKVDKGKALAAMQQAAATWSQLHTAKRTEV